MQNKFVTIFFGNSERYIYLSIETFSKFKLNCGHKFNPIKDAKKRKNQQLQEEMAQNNPIGLAIASIGGGLAFILLFVSGVSIWWSVILFLAAIIIPAFTGNKK